MRSRTSSSAVSRTRGSPRARTSASSASMRSLTARRFFACGTRSSAVVRPTMRQNRRVALLHHLAVAEVHVDAARQAGVEAADRAHDVDALELVGRILL